MSIGSPAGQTCHWVALDLLGLALVVGFAQAFRGMVTGIWWPFGTITFDYWPLLLFPVWVATGSTIAVLAGLQLTAI